MMNWWMDLARSWVWGPTFTFRISHSDAFQRAVKKALGPTNCPVEGQSRPLAAASQASTSAPPRPYVDELAMRCTTTTYSTHRDSNLSDGSVPKETQPCLPLAWLIISRTTATATVTANGAPSSFNATQRQPRFDSLRCDSHRRTMEENFVLIGTQGATTCNHSCALSCCSAALVPFVVT